MSTLQVEIIRVPVVFGTTKESILCQLQKLKVPLPDEEFLKLFPPEACGISESLPQSFVLRRKDVAIALWKMGKDKAAAYYENTARLGTYLALRQKYGRLVGKNSPGFSQEELLEYMRVMHQYSGSKDIEQMNTWLQKSGESIFGADGTYFISRN